MAEATQDSTITSDTANLIGNGTRRSKWYGAFLFNSNNGSPETTNENPCKLILSYQTFTSYRAIHTKTLHTNHSNILFIAGTLSTLNGVIVPVCLSMFSSLLFLRVGYIVGNAGLIYSILQLVMAYSILICTVCSISAIATNGAVKGGGVYFMISRTLGPQLGGSVGILFYCANVVAGALYASGFAETLIANFGPSPNGERRMIENALPAGAWYSFAYASGVLVFCLVRSSSR